MSSPNAASTVPDAAAAVAAVPAAAAAAAPLANGTDAPPAAAKPRQNKNRNKSKPQAGVLDDANLELEFLNFMAKLRNMQMGHTVAYQVNNYPQGVECTFRISRDEASVAFTSDFKPLRGGTQKKDLAVKERKELTPEQLAKLEAKREKRKAVRAKKLAERMAAKEAESSSPEAAGDGAKDLAASPAVAAPGEAAK